MTKKVAAIEGIGETYATILNNVGIRTTNRLLEAGNTRVGRQHLASHTGLSEQLILRWVNMADLFRIKGVAGQYAELLEAAGIDTVGELRNRNAENLTQRLYEINEERKLVRQTPARKTVDKWIEQAKAMQPMISH